MDRIIEVLALLGDEAQVAGLSSNDLTSLRDELRVLAAQVLDGTIVADDKVGLLTQIAELAANDGGIAYILAVRDEATAAEQMALDALAARLAAVDPDPDPEPEDEPAEPEVAAPTLAVVPDPAPEAAPAAPVVEAVAAPVAALPALGTISPPAANAPAAAAATTPRIMRMRDRQYVDVDEFVGEIIEARDSFASYAGGGTDFVRLGRITTEYPTELSMDGVDMQTQNSRLSVLLDRAWDPARWSGPEGEALVASGGFSAPGMPDYSIPVISGTQRPVADYLPSVQASRGQIITIVPPTLATIVSSTAQVAGSAISVWTNTIDTTPAGTTKPRQTITAPSTVTTATEAIVERLRIGNFQARAFPELVRAWLDLAASAWARRAESELLRQIDTLSAAQTTTQVLGATADFFGYLRQAAAAQRSRHRMPRNARLRCLIPGWFIDFVGADVAHMHAGDGLERFTQDPEQFVRAAFNAAGVNVTFYEDTAGTGAANQVFLPVQINADLQNFPPGPGVTSARVIWYLFPEGTFARGDGGTLDLGIVRDSTLNDTNDYEFFTESWECVIPHVIESLKVTSTLCVTGAGAIDVASSAYCTAS